VKSLTGQRSSTSETLSLHVWNSEGNRQKRCKELHRCRCFLPLVHSWKRKVVWHVADQPEHLREPAPNKQQPPEGPSSETQQLLPSMARTAPWEKEHFYLTAWRSFSRDRRCISGDIKGRQTRRPFLSSQNWKKTNNPNPNQAPKPLWWGTWVNGGRSRCLHSPHLTPGFHCVPHRKKTSLICRSYRETNNLDKESR